MTVESASSAPGLDVEPDPCEKHVLLGTGSVSFDDRSAWVEEIGLTPDTCLDRETSLHVAKRTRAQYRRCWVNAASALPHLGDAALYVEGWICVEPVAPLVVEHGWCELAGRIVDPTYTPHVSTLEEPLAYFPGIRLKPAEAANALRRRALPSAWLADELSYRSAFESALRYSRRFHGPRDARSPTRVVHCRQEAFDVYIGRPTVWGNPFRIGIDGTRTEVISKFREWIIRRPTRLRALDGLRGKVLGCFCAPEPCHGDVLAELADLGDPISQL